MSEDDISWREKGRALARVARYRPKLTFGIVLFGMFAAILEGIGLSFIVPIVEVARADDPAAMAAESDGILATFVTIYEVVGIPFTLEFLVVGVAGVMAVRFTASFLVAWLRAYLGTNYEKEMRTRAVDGALDAEIGYFDREGSDHVLNAVITETRYSKSVISYVVRIGETLFLVSVYLVIAFALSPALTLFAIGLFAVLTFLVRYVFESGYSVGNRVADANEAVQQAVQAGTQGIRDVKLFGLADETFERFHTSVRQYASASIKLTRNKAAIQNFYDFATAVTVFSLIYLALAFANLSFGALGLFLFAMFRLSPLVSKLNSDVYNLEGNLSHLVRTQAFVDELESRRETSGDRSPPDPVQRVEYDSVAFSYDDERVLHDVSFSVGRGEFIAFVGQSGAGKSTIVSLLARLYDPDSGEIRADGVPIEEFDVEEWRERVAVVRQSPFIFNDTLWRNVTVGNREASREEVERVCAISRVDEFMDELPAGYDTQLGDDGVRLSGGQRQRVALARALLKDADLLVLDEATSDLDTNLERDVQSSIESMDRDYAILAIAHRLSTVKHADRIYTVDAGEIVESGSHAELVDRDGQYAQLYKIQT